VQGKGQGLSGAAAHVAGSSDNALIAMSGIERSWLEPSPDLRIDRYEAPAQGKLARFPLPCGVHCACAPTTMLVSRDSDATISTS